MIPDEDMRRFKRAFWGSNSIIQINEGEAVHKLKSIRERNAKFLEGCVVNMYGLPVEFFEVTEMGIRGRKVVGFEVKGCRPMCYCRLSPNEVPALDGLYNAFMTARGSYLYGSR